MARPVDFSFSLEACPACSITPMSVSGDFGASGDFGVSGDGGTGGGGTAAGIGAAGGGGGGDIVGGAGAATKGAGGMTDAGIATRTERPLHSRTVTRLIEHEPCLPSSAILVTQNICSGVPDPGRAPSMMQR